MLKQSREPRLRHQPEPHGLGIRRLVFGWNVRWFSVSGRVCLLNNMLARVDAGCLAFNSIW